LSPTLLGISVQLELVCVTILYSARESLRVALQRQPPSIPSPTLTASKEKDDASRPFAKQTQIAINLSYLPVLVGFIISFIVGFTYWYRAPLEVLSSADFNLAYGFYAAATLIELSAEPAFIVIQQRALYKERARAETSAAIARCITACIIAIYSHRQGWNPSVLPFAIGQTAYAMVLRSMYSRPVTRIAAQNNFSTLPVKIDFQTRQNTPYHLGYFHKPTLALAATMYLQSIFKLLLTQGDALILSMFSSLDDLGAFGLASNYGGLLARLVFQPVEESSRNTFGRLLAPPSPLLDHDDDPDSNSTDDDKRNADAAPKNKPKQTVEEEEEHEEKKDQALTYLSTTLHFYLLLALPLLSIAPYALPLLIRHIVGRDWYTPSTATLLSTYCYYIPLMAINGILDALVTSVATPAELRAQSAWTMVITAVYGAGAWVLLVKWELGGVGLVGANMVNMGMRILWGAWFVDEWMRKRGRARGKTVGVWGLVKRIMPSVGAVVVTGGIVLGLRFVGGGAKRDGVDGQLDAQFLGYLLAGTVLLGSTM
jgi:hypothetical protein